MLPTGGARTGCVQLPPIRPSLPCGSSEGTRVHCWAQCGLWWLATGRAGWRGPGGMAVDSETACAAMDASDELSFVRERFVLPVGKIYLDGAWPAQPVGTASGPHVARATLVA